MYARTRRSGPAALLALAFLACGAAPAAAAMPRITFSTDFGFNGRHAYYYVAQEKGFYRDAGFDVEIIRGSGSADAIRTVAAGRAQLGFADAGTLVISRTNQGLPAKLVAMVYTKPPHAIFCQEDAGIRTAKDLEGKTIADTAGSANPAMFPALARAAGVDKDKVKWIVADGAALPAMLVSRQVDCVAQYSVGQALLERRVAPKKLTRILYADAGLDFYSNGIIVGDAYLKESPDIVRKFVAATVRGMETAFADPAEAGRILNKVHPQVEPTIGQAETEAVRELAVTPQTRQRGLGFIDPKKMEQTRDVVAESFNLSKRIPVEDLFAPGFAGK
jgi:NitT/TauT family transport system substrate-binding protein